MAETPIINTELLNEFENLRRILSALKVNSHLLDFEKNLNQKLKDRHIDLPDDIQYIFLNFDKIKIAIDSVLESLNLELVDKTLLSITFNEELVELTKNLSSEYQILNEKINLLHISATAVNNSIDLNINNINFAIFLNENFKDLSTNSETLLFCLDEIDIIIKKILLLSHSLKYKYYNILEEKYITRFRNESEILFKNFQANANRFLTETVHQSKKIKTDYENLHTDYTFVKKEIDELTEKTNELKKVYSGFEKRLQQLADSRSEDIQLVLEDKLKELERLNEDKIDLIDTSYQQAKLNYEDFTKLVEMSGTYVLTDNYKIKSNEEKKDYITNRRWTVASISLAIFTTVIVIGLPIYEYWKANPPVETNYYTIFARLTISIMFFVLALYTSRQAAKHYECYQENHRTYLQLAALEPYISRMTPEEQKEIRISLIPILFSQSSDGKFASKGDEVGLPESFTAAIEKLIDTVKEVKAGQNSQKPDGN